MTEDKLVCIDHSVDYSVDHSVDHSVDEGWQGIVIVHCLGGESCFAISCAQ